MNYSNSPIPPDTNRTRENTFKQLFILGTILVVLAGVSFFAIMKMASWGATFIPFKYELMFVQQLGLNRIPELASTKKQELQGERIDSFEIAQIYLQGLVDKVAKVQGIYETMPMTAHLVLSDQVNAFATLGGHLFFHQGLLKKLDSENALVMLIGHEVAHIYYRDPIRTVGGTLLTGLFIEWVTGGSGIGAVIIGDQTARLVISGFSREQESKADTFAVETLQKLYGHSNGGSVLFEILLKESNPSQGITGLWDSHPNTQARLKAMPASSGSLKPLDVDFNGF